MRRRIFRVAAAALLVVAPGAPAVSADIGGPIESATLVLRESLTLTTDHVGNIVVSADDVTLDCAGHAVSGPASDPLSGGIEIAGVSRVTVRNCVITGFEAQNGIFGYGSEIRLDHNTIYGNANHGIHLDSVSDTTVVGNTIRDNGLNGPSAGIVLTRSTTATITSNTITGQGWGGILLAQTTTDSLVTDNTTRGNGIGIILDEASNGNILRRNVASRNDHGFTILASSENVIEANTANGNAHAGFQVDAESSSNTFSGNTANVNLDGFGLRGVDDNVLVGNTANNNRHAGFLVWGGSGDNTVSGNTGHSNAWFDAYDEGTGTGNSWYGNTFRTTAGL